MHFLTVIDFYFFIVNRLNYRQSLGFSKGPYFSSIHSFLPQLKMMLLMEATNRKTCKLFDLKLRCSLSSYLLKRGSKLRYKTVARTISFYSPPPRFFVNEFIALSVNNANDLRLQSCQCYALHELEYVVYVFCVIDSSLLPHALHGVACHCLMIFLYAANRSTWL